MRFVVTAEWKENHLLRLVLGWFLIYVALLWITNVLLFFSQMSLDPTVVAEFYRGAEERFNRPRSFKVLLEISHFHLFAMGILILTMTHLVLFAPLTVRTKAMITIVSFSSALLDEASGWLIRFVHPGFAYLKIGAFLTLQLALASMVVIVGWAVWSTPPSGYGGEPAPGASGASQGDGAGGGCSLASGATPKSTSPPAAPGSHVGSDVSRTNGSGAPSPAS